MKAKTKTRFPQRRQLKASLWERPLTMALGAGLLLAGFVVYLLLAKTGTSSSGPNQVTIAKGGAVGIGLTGHGFGNDDSSRSADSATTKSDGLSNADDSSVDFSGIKSTIDPALAAANSAPKSSPQAVPDIPLPLVFQTVDSHRLNISPEQQKIIARLQQNFLDMIGGANQDPTDPQYLQRWQQAQPLVNEQLEAQLGQTFFLKYESAAAQPATTPAHENPRQ